MTNWSVILNVLLLVGVVFAIVRMISTKRRMKISKRFEPSLRHDVTRDVMDDIIAVRKIEPEPELEASEPEIEPQIEPHVEVRMAENKPAEPATLVLFLLAKEQRKLAGYELLQSILASGLRFGEGQLFHRHQFANGQGPVVCSLATATADGTFDLQNMGAFSVHGLCLFMEASGNSSIDLERFSIMLDTANQLRESLDTYLLDDTRNPWSDTSLERYHRLLNVPTSEQVAVICD